VPYDVAAVIRSLDADVVCVAESWRPRPPSAEIDGRDAPSLLDPLTADGYRIESLLLSASALESRRYREYRAAGRWELAVCTRLPVLGRRDLPVGRVPNDPVGVRHALAVTVDVGGTPVEVVAFHASSKLWRAGPVRHLRALRGHLVVDRPTIVAGDCNLWGPAVTLLLPGFTRAVRGRTYPAPRPHSQIDHVLVDGFFTPLGGRVGPATPSDHRPVWARLRLDPEPAR
jgi:endonuclease/exonuclease/phosphatase (EEP) superfamily protein YafD